MRDGGDGRGDGYKTVLWTVDTVTGKAAPTKITTGTGRTGQWSLDFDAPTQPTLEALPLSSITWLPVTSV